VVVKFHAPLTSAFDELSSQLAFFGCCTPKEEFHSMYWVEG
jgi:hypothetical protein